MRIAGGAQPGDAPSISIMAVEYGTLEPAVEQKSSSKSRASVVAAVLVVSAVVALGFTASFGKTNSVVDSNFARGEVAVVEDDVETLFTQTCEDWENTRFTMAVFNKDYTAVVPAIQVGATTHWERDFEAFKNALPDEGVAFAVYNFPVWSDEDDYEVIPTFVTYLAEGSDIRSKYRGGAFLGSVAIAARCTGKSMVAVDADSTYLDVCRTLASDEQCRAVNNEVCPFKESDGNPCNNEACVDTTNFAVGEFGEPCCDAIDVWCAANEGSAGCSDYARSVYQDHCGGAYNLGDVQKKLLEGFADEDDVCEDDCRSPCMTFDIPSETYAKCSGCATDGQVYEYDGGRTFAASCFPGQYKFQEQRCCGTGENQAVCGAYGSNDECESMPDIEAGCSWETHVDCGEKIAAAEAEAAEKAELAELVTEPPTIEGGDDVVAPE